MSYPVKTDISLRRVKLAYGICAVRVLAAIDAAAGQERGQLCNGNAVKLLMEDVIQELLQIGDLVLKTANQALCDLAEENAAFAGGVKEPSVGASKQFLRQQIEHGVCHLRRGKDLVV